LQGEVTVERDKLGRATHPRLAPWKMQWKRKATWWAQDRLWQMDLLRRASRGQLSEILGPGTLKIDMDFRNLNFGRAAERELQEMNPESRKASGRRMRGA